MAVFDGQLTWVPDLTWVTKCGSASAMAVACRLNASSTAWHPQLQSCPTRSITHWLQAVHLQGQREA